MSCFCNDCDCGEDFGGRFEDGRCCGRRRRCGFCGRRGRRCCGEFDRDFGCERAERDRRCENVEIKFEKKIERSCCSDRECRECGRDNRCCF